jgi:NAD(P)-dependent dehydrogenase (short-subunit alcohol dehydrogenase family)
VKSSGFRDFEAVRHGYEVAGDGVRVGAGGQVVFVNGALEAVAKVCSVNNRGVRVNAVSPGPIDTSGITELVGEENSAAFKADLGAEVAIGRIGRPEEVAAAVAFLESADSSYMMGANLHVEGGENQI